VAPTATAVTVGGIPVLHQLQTGTYNFVDADSDTEGTSIYKWFRVVNSVPTEIAGANQTTYLPETADIDCALAFQVTPVDEHGFAGTPVMSTPTPVIIPLPAPQNFAATLQPPDTVVLTWERPQYFDGRGFVGYRLFRNGLNISTITNPATLTFTDTYVQNGTHEYYVCSLFNNRMELSGPSNTVTVVVGQTANDDQIVEPQNSLQVYPNPFKASTRFDVRTKAGEPVNVSVYNLKGQLVQSFDLRSDASGNASANWDGTLANGSQAQSGIYYYRMNSAKFSRQGKIILMK